MITPEIIIKTVLLILKSLFNKKNVPADVDNGKIKDPNFNPQ